MSGYAEHQDGSWPRALLPAVFLTLVTWWSGTFLGAAAWSGAVGWQVSLLAVAALGLVEWRDSLRLGQAGRWLVPVLLLAVGLSWAVSPVHRAGTVGALLLPVFLLVPSAVARCWESVQDRQVGVRALTLVTGLTAGWALLRWALDSDDAPAMPLGHSNLLVGWLVAVLPFSVYSLQRQGLGRVGGGVVACLATVALCATRSLVGVLSLALELLLGSFLLRRLRVWALLAGVSIALTQLPRGLEVIEGLDRSANERSRWAAVALAGARERPLLGWGPGSVPWTVGRFVPGRGLVLGDLHSLPLQLVFETGLSGLLATGILLVAFVRRRLLDVPKARDPALLRASLVSFGGSLVFCLGNAPLTVPALPAVWAVTAGAALAAASNQPRPTNGRGQVVSATYLLGVLILLVPGWRAHRQYDLAVESADPHASLVFLERAVELDPFFPFYRTRAALLRTTLFGSERETALDALEGAEGAFGVSALWLAAGRLAAEAGEDWADDALEQASRLDPQLPFAHFHRLMLQPHHDLAVSWGVMAIRADPRVGAARFWVSEPALWNQVERRLTGLGFPPKFSPAESNRSLERSASLILTIDGKPATSFSLYAFRRRPWKARLTSIAVDRARLRRNLEERTK